MLDRLANWKTILIIFLVAVVGFNVILFPSSAWWCGG
jgi:hypothetical protein